ncbi:MAG: D-glycero-alpha-D-manno-heptose-1,7-bisphosphate 7-phosphatase [Vicinamibacterales bacterium]
MINRPIVREGRPHAPVRFDELEILPGVPAALDRLRAAGFRLVVVTNQPEVARGTLPADVLRAMHQHLLESLPLDDVRACTHDDRDACSCRKPQPGLLLDAANDENLSLASSFMVGDRWRDVEAGRRAGCRTIFIDWGYHERPPDAPDATVASLAEAADWILSPTRSDAA